MVTDAEDGGGGPLAKIVGEGCQYGRGVSLQVEGAATQLAKADVAPIERGISLNL